jgi:hypothetical protein
LFAEVLDDPTKNTAEYLDNRAKELVTHEINTLKMLANQGKMGVVEINTYFLGIISI